jgi:hypothetical protein
MQNEPIMLNLQAAIDAAWADFFACFPDGNDNYAKKQQNVKIIRKRNHGKEVKPKDVVNLVRLTCHSSSTSD